VAELARQPLAQQRDLSVASRLGLLSERKKMSEPSGCSVGQLASLMRGALSTIRLSSAWRKDALQPDHGDGQESG
jgi:hypothetical protein